MRPRFLLTLLATPLALIFPGCATVAHVSPAATEAALAAGDATLELTRSGGTLPFYVGRIDGPAGRIDLALTPLGGFHRLKPGLTTITVKTMGFDYTSPTVDPDASVAHLILFAQPGVAYTLHGVEAEQTLTVFIAERNTLRPITSEVTIPVSRPQATPRDAPRWEPVFNPGPTPLIVPVPAR